MNQSRIKCVKGDLFEAVAEQSNVVIAHVCNDKSVMGAGFVIPLSKRFPVAREKYLAEKVLNLGYAQIVPVDDEKKIYVANMIAQHGVGPDANGKPPIRYAALCSAMILVAGVAKVARLSIHAPKFGAGLAGGNWDFIATLIEELWTSQGIPVTIYSLE